MLLSDGQIHPSAILLLRNVPHLPAERQTGQIFSIASVMKEGKYSFII